MKYHLAIDIGASGGRHILGYTDAEGRPVLEEVFRFENGVKNEGGSLIWDISELEKNVKLGIRKCAEIGKIPDTVAIDTWGVDYVLLDRDLKPLLPVYAYRDSRTDESVRRAETELPFDMLYSKTGIQFQKFNTVYQLMCDAKSGKLDRAEHFMMMPDYLAYTLCGKMANEYTNASTTGMLDPYKRTWDMEIVERAGIKKDILLPLSMPSTLLGNFTPEMRGYAGFDAEVVLCGSHDTASAVASSPIEADGMYISSGTWSLVGMELDDPVLGKEAYEANFSNEGGLCGKIRFLKNIPGMWMIQNIRKEINKSKSYDEMMYMAKGCGKYSYIDATAPELTAPESMIKAISYLAGDPDMPLEQVLATVYHSLARSYKETVEETEKITGKKISSIAIVGGGSADAYLNELTAEYTGKPIFAGPKEATALGNIVAQMIYSGELKGLGAAREMLKSSSLVRRFS